MRTHWFAAIFPLIVSLGLLTACQPAALALAPATATPPVTPDDRPPPARATLTPTVRPPRRRPTVTALAPPIGMPTHTSAPTYPSATSTLTPVLPTPSPSPVPTSVQYTGWRERPISELSAEAADFLASREGAVGVTIAVPDQHTLYTYQGHDLLHLASVAKILTMLTLLEQAEARQRALTPYEYTLLEPMIVHSDNDTADRLWQMINGAPGVLEYVHSLALSEVIPDTDGYWGASVASAADMALLLAKLVQGETLSPSHRQLALDLLNRVDLEYDTWAVTADLAADLGNGYMGHKDGWYWADDGWWVTSVGFVMPEPPEPAYTVALLTNQQPGLEYAVETIETTARLIHFSLKGQAVTPTPP